MIKSKPLMPTESKSQRQPTHDTAHQPELPLLGLHQAIEQSGAYQSLVPRRQMILKAYMTTGAPMGDLMLLAGVNTTAGVCMLIHRSMQQAWEYLPLEIRAEYKSPKDAIRRKSGKLTPISRRRLKDKLAENEDHETGQIEFKAPHKQHLSEAASRRWQRERAARRAAQLEDQETQSGQKN